MISALLYRSRGEVFTLSQTSTSNVRTIATCANLNRIEEELVVEEKAIVELGGGRW